VHHYLFPNVLQTYALPSASADGKMKMMDPGFSPIVNHLGLKPTLYNNLSNGIYAVANDRDK